MLAAAGERPCLQRPLEQGFPLDQRSGGEQDRLVRQCLAVARIEAEGLVRGLKAFLPEWRRLPRAVHRIGGGAVRDCHGGPSP